MMTTGGLMLGAVYQTNMDTRPFRVLAFDNFEVFYDCYWPSLDRWTFDNLRSRGYYYRTTPVSFLDGATFLHESPLSSKEFQTFRPDLPFRVCRNRKINWTDIQYPKIEDYEQMLHHLGIDLFEDVILSIPQLVLHPFGPKKGVVKPLVLESENTVGFTCLDLLWKAHNAQAPYIRQLLEGGIGIHRLGHEKKMPAYYIGHFISSGGIMIPDD